MDDREHALFARYVADVSGIVLDESKRYLLESRLADVAFEAKCSTYTELYAKAKTSADKKLERRIIDAITTNETSFFRDPKAFDLIKLKLVPDMLGEDVRKPLAIWSAAASTGQEAYSIAIALRQVLFDLSQCRIRILGTDISEAAVNAANRGDFSTLEVGRGLDKKLVDKHFTPISTGYRIAPDLRAICQFRVDNLLSLRTNDKFDVILCRNVLIYFSQTDKAKVLENLIARLNPTGVLLVGSTESLVGVTDRLRRLEHHGSSYYEIRK